MHLHHLCQGEFEKKFEDVLGEVEMSKRCVSCLLLENDLFTKEICNKIGCSIKQVCLMRIKVCWSGGENISPTSHW